MKNLEKLLDRVFEHIQIENFDEIIRLHDYYTERINGCDDYIYNMDDFDDILYGKKPSEIADMIVFGKFNSCDPYFRFNGYGNLESIEYNDTSFIDLQAIAEYITETGNSLDNEHIREIIEEFNAQEEEE